MNLETARKAGNTALEFGAAAAAVVYLSGQALGASAITKARMARELALNTYGPDRTFDEISQAKGTVKVALWSAPYSKKDALNALTITDEEAGVKFKAGGTSATPGNEKQFYIYMANESGPGSLRINVSGDTTNTDFLEVALAAKGATSFEEAETMVRQAAEDILGDKFDSFGYRATGTAPGARPN